MDHDIVIDDITVIAAKMNEYFACHITSEGLSLKISFFS